jgi:hypothetical protein
MYHIGSSRVAALASFDSALPTGGSGSSGYPPPRL